MVLSEAEKAARAKAEREALAAKKAEKERIEAEIRADRDRFNAVKTASKEDTAAPPPRLTIRVRYTVDGQKGRRPVELEGTTASVSLFHFYQAIEEQFHVAPPRQILRPADESTFPVEPREEALPAYNSFASMEAFPSLESLGLRSGQEIFLSQASEEVTAPSQPPSEPQPPQPPQTGEEERPATPPVALPSPP
ncbi:unnamed protein product, partial [Effrenium voratum]